MWEKESKKVRRMMEEDEGMGIRCTDYHGGILTKCFEKKAKRLKEDDDGTGTKRVSY